jgi:hypothetical protein
MAQIIMLIADPEKNTFSSDSQQYEQYNIEQKV